MKNFSILLFSLLTLNLSASDIEKSFINIPDALFPILDKQQRMEALEYYKAGSDSIENRFGKQSKVLIFDNVTKHLKIQSSQSSTFEMMIFQPDTTKSPITGIIRTICAPICQSSIMFLDSTWNLIPNTFEIPKANKWIDAEALKQQEDTTILQNLNYINFVSCSFDANKQEIVVQNHSIDFLSEEEKEKAASFTKKEAIIYPLKDLFK